MPTIECPDPLVSCVSKSDMASSSMLKLKRLIGQSVPIRYLASEWSEEMTRLIQVNQRYVCTQLCPPKCKWTADFLKWVIQNHLEPLQGKNNFEIEDILFETIAEILGTTDSRGLSITKRYHLTNDEVVYILEEDCAISQQGTTGLCTWQASLYLLEFILSSTEISTSTSNDLMISGKSILELGSGCGMLGISLAKLGALKVTLTDVSDAVLDRLRKNVDINFNLGNSNCFIERLDWTASSASKYKSGFKENVLLEHYDLCICADVIYDPSCVSSLVQTLKTIICRNQDSCESKIEPDIIMTSERLHANTKCILAHTNRNPETFRLFGKLISEAGLCLRPLTFVTKRECSFFYPESTDSIVLLEIHKATM